RAEPGARQRRRARLGKAARRSERRSQGGRLSRTPASLRSGSVDRGDRRPRRPQLRRRGGDLAPGAAFLRSALVLRQAQDKGLGSILILSLSKDGRNADPSNQGGY